GARPRTRLAVKRSTEQLPSVHACRLPDLPTAEAAMRQEIHFSLRGMAPVSGGRTRWAWRRRIREAAVAAHSSTVTSSSMTFEVHLVFYLSPWRLFRIDLDRLTTPVLDTLFASRDPLAHRALSGGLSP